MSAELTNKKDSSPDDSQTEEEFLPISNISRIMKMSIDQNLKLSKESKKLIDECVTEFICFITSEASEKCKRERKKTISSDDILTVMNHLGFENYVVLLKVYYHKYKQS
jgi:histone H3/H4